jgi:hypothetical protein
MGIDVDSSALNDLYHRLHLLSTAERERDIALDAYHEREAEAARLRVEIDQLQKRLEALRAERDALQAWKRSVLAICALPHEQMGASEKVGWIVGHEERPYPASVHGGPEDVRLISMGRWAENMGCSLKTVTKVAERLEAAGTLAREKIEVGDGRTHYSMRWNEEHWIRPSLSLPAEPRAHNGGNKRCPQCGGYCKKKVLLTYVCEACGLDFDASMTPLARAGMAPPPPPPPPPSSPALPEPEPEPEPIRPQFGKRPPLRCYSCGREGQWTPTIGGRYRHSCGNHQAGI